MPYYCPCCSTPLFVTRLPWPALLGQMRTRVVQSTVLEASWCAPCPWAGGAQIRHRPYVWIFGYFRHEAPHHHRGADRATRLARHGAHQGHAHFRRAAERRQWAGVLLALVSLFMLSRSGRREGRFRAQRLDTLHRPGRRHGCRQRAVRQIGIMARLDRSSCKLVQPLPILHDGRPDRRGMVAEARLRAFPHWAIPLISVFLSLADFAYLMACAIPTP